MEGGGGGGSISRPSGRKGQDWEAFIMRIYALLQYLVETMLPPFMLQMI